MVEMKSNWVESVNDDPSIGDWCYGIGSKEVFIVGHGLLSTISGYKLISTKPCPYIIFQSPEAQEILGEIYELNFDMDRDGE